MRKQLLLFDLGGVLADLRDPVAAMELEMDTQQFWNIWLNSPLVRAYETGAITTAEFSQKVASELGRSSGAEFDVSLRSWKLRMFPDSERFIRSVASEFQLALLSNTNELHWQQIRSQTRVFSWFDRLFLSFETGKYKPEAAAFEQAIDYFGGEPGDILFLDDNARNVKAARDIGIRAVRVSGIGEAKQAIDDYYDDSRCW